MDKCNSHGFPWDEEVYGTGRTQPRKSHISMIAALLILVIFLSGVIVFLSVMNVRLLTRLSDQQPQQNHPIVFSQRGSEQASSPSAQATLEDDQGEALLHAIPALGVQVEEVSPFYQHYYNLPAGVIVTSVDPASPAQQLGIAPGDILTALGSDPIADPQALNDALAQRAGTVTVTVYRSGVQLTFQLTLQS